MVRWYHAIFSAYGFWLPNDPRGSWSDWVYARELFRFGGPANKVSDKRSYAHDPHDAQFRREMKEHLKYPPARFDPTCRATIGRGFANACEEFDICLLACAIGFDHVHVVAARHPRYSIEEIVQLLKTRARQAMNAEDTHPMRRFRTCPTPWSKGRWSVFINDESQLESAIQYVERHPIKEGLARQRWEFVQPHGA